MSARTERSLDELILRRMLPSLGALGVDVAIAAFGLEAALVVGVAACALFVTRWR